MPCAALTPHPDTPCAALRAISVSVERKAETLRLVYALEGEIERLRVPASAPRRVSDRLWEHTCCELFFARVRVAGYWEMNFSPSGEWAAYRFEGYRESRAAADIPAEIVVSQARNRLTVAACIPVSEAALRIGLSAVVEEQSGALSYWALRHAPGRPDFHHPDSFALELE